MNEKKLMPEIRFYVFGKDWKQQKLKEVANYIRGSFPQPYTNPDWYDEKNGKPFVQVADIGFDLRLNENTKQHISKIAESKSRFVDEETVIVALQGSIERSIGRVALTQYPAFFDRTILIFESYKVPMDKKYFAQVIQNLFRIEKERAWGATISTITKAAVSEFVIGIPEKKEQEKIGLFFCQLDNIITLQQQLLNDHKQLKKAMLQKMFPQKGETVPRIRFSGFTDSWEENELSELAMRFDNLRIPITSSKRVLVSTPYYGANGIQGYVEGYTHDGEFILVAEDGANDLKNYPVQYVSGKVWVNNHAHVLSGIPGTADNHFLMNSIKQKNIEAFLVGGGRAKLNANIMMKINFYIPGFDEQEKIGGFFNHLDKTIILHQKKLETYQELKKAMLQKMFV